MRRRGLAREDVPSELGGARAVAARRERERTQRGSLRRQHRCAEAPVVIVEEDERGARVAAEERGASAIDRGDLTREDRRTRQVFGARARQRSLRDGERS